MSEPKYTKGPWSYCDGGIFGEWDDAKNERPTIANVENAGMNGPQTKEGLANGRLLAASWDMLQALKEVEIEWASRSDGRAKMVFDAIAKAERA